MPKLYHEVQFDTDFYEQIHTDTSCLFGFLFHRNLTSNVSRQCSLCVSFLADWLQPSPEGGGLSLIIHILLFCSEYIKTVNVAITLQF